MTKKLKFARGKLRRFTLVKFRKAYVDKQTADRHGECNHCGDCCAILLRCPFLINLDDGSSQCSIYENRPGQCAAFPIEERDLADVAFNCTYTFGDQVEDLVGIETPQGESTAGASPEPSAASRRLNPILTIPFLLIYRLLNRTR